jgi:uncharacterized protein involved in type VI secretion and phage assembly
MNFTGVCVATVVGLDDPEGEARVRVEFPMLPTGPKSGWAPLARPFAGAGRGMYYMPEVGDEALVAFEHGDFDHPFIVGFLWNGQDGQPDDGIDENVRRIQSKAGHQIDIDDNPGTGGIVLKTAAGNTVELSDDPLSADIQISTSFGTSITVDDTTGIALTTTLGQITVNNTGITVTASNVTVASPLITATAPLLTVIAAETEFRGLLTSAGFFQRMPDQTKKAVP